MVESFRPRASATFAAVPYGSTQCSSRDLLARSLRSMFGCMSTAYDSSPNNAATVGLHALLRDAGQHAPILVLHLRPDDAGVLLLGHSDLAMAATEEMVAQLQVAMACVSTMPNALLR